MISVFLIIIFSFFFFIYTPPSKSIWWGGGLEERDQEIHSLCTKPSYFPSTPLLNIPWNKSPLWCSKNKACSSQDKLQSLKEGGQILLTATPSLRQQGCTCVWIVKSSLNIQGQTVISCISLVRDQQLHDRGQHHSSGLQPSDATATSGAGWVCIWKSYPRYGAALWPCHPDVPISPSTTDLWCDLG